MIQIGLVGYGYWGPKLARNFATLPGVRLAWVCEMREKLRDQAALAFPSAQTTPNYDDILRDDAVQAVLIATQVEHHFDLARRALLAGKDVLVEKPITRTVEEAQELVRIAEGEGRILAVDHTFLYTGAVQKMKELVDSGELGDLLYFDSVRVNLGLFQPDVNVIYDLAPHDLSILSYLYDEPPVSVMAMGACHACSSKESLAYVHVEYASGFMAHFHFSWLAPVKIRKTLIAGSRRMIVYDDLEASEKVKVYDKGIVVTPDDASLHRIKVDYRAGDMWAPKLQHREALGAEAEHFINCVRQRTRPLADGRDGARIVKILQATQESLRQGGQRIALEPE